jgi:hypothetical protein
LRFQEELTGYWVKNNCFLPDYNSVWSKQIPGKCNQSANFGQFIPVIFKKNVELGFGTGLGYRFSGYPSQPLKSNGDSWEEGKNFKGIVQIPLQLSAGYRSILISSVSLTPFFSYQLQAMFGYNPDFDPLPDSNFMLGFKFKFNNN